MSISYHLKVILIIVYDLVHSLHVDFSITTNWVRYYFFTQSYCPQKKLDNLTSFKTSPELIHNKIERLNALRMTIGELSVVCCVNSIRSFISWNRLWSICRLPHHLMDIFDEYRINRISWDHLSFYIVSEVWDRSFQNYWLLLSPRLFDRISFSSHTCWSVSFYYSWRYPQASDLKEELFCQQVIFFPTYLFNCSE